MGDIFVTKEILIGAQRRRGDAIFDGALSGMPPTAFEHTVNEARGYACLLITISSFIIVLIDPRCLSFWRRDGYSLNTASTGMLGIATSSAFLLYLLIDTLVGIACSHKFRRPMTAVYVHHVIVGIGTAAFLLPGAPPRGFFLYVWGEALTAVRVLPSGPRHDARSFVFAGRRALWIYLLLRDVTSSNGRMLYTAPLPRRCRRSSLCYCSSSIGTGGRSTRAAARATRRDAGRAMVRRC